MAVVNDGKMAAMAENSAPQAYEPLDATLQAVATALGMDPNPKNELQRPDVNYLQELMKLPVNFASMPPGTDVPAMREWIKEVFMKGLAESRASLNIPLWRPMREISKEIISVESTDGNGEFGLWIYEPPAQTADEQTPRPIIVMFHGGGWIHGNPAGDEALAEGFASELDAIVFGVDYRLAPEHPFPAPLDDCNQTLEWIVQNADKYNIDLGRVGLWGASAGGNLAAAVALGHAMTGSTTSPIRLSLVSLAVPVTAHPEVLARFEEHRSFPKSQNELLFTDTTSVSEASLLQFQELFDLYTGGKIDTSNPMLSPLVAKSVSGHAATYVTIAACDGLRAQGQAYAELLRLSGVTVTEDILPGVPHMFNLPMDAAISKTWHKKQIEAFATAFGLPAV